jgi:CDP-diglyceride synthetase
MKRIMDWLLQHKLGMIVGAIVAILLSVISLKTGNSFFILAFPGVFLGGALFTGSFGLPGWIEVTVLVLNIIVFSFVGAFVESLLRRKNGRK